MKQLNYKREGKGYPLVLVHGYLGGAEMWRDQIVFFNSRFDVIAPDLAGFGASAGLEAPDTIDAAARQVLQLLTDLGIRRFHLLGHSMGGMIVKHMTAIAPERVAKLVCYGTGPIGVLPDRFESIEDSRSRLERDGLKATVRRIAATWFVEESEAEGYPVCVALGDRTTMQAALASLSAWETWDGRPALPAIETDTLVVWGDRDRSYGWSQPEALWRGIAGSALAVVPGCAHNVHMEKSHLFNAIVEDFLPVNP